MTLGDNKRCLLCGSDNPIGLRLQFTAKGGRAVTSFRIPENFQGWDGISHGGIVSALLDEAMYHALASLGWSGVTAEMTVRFVKPVPVETPLRLEGEVTMQRGRFGQARAWIGDPPHVLAEGRGKFLTPAAER